MTMIDNPTWTLADRLRRSRLLAGLEQAEVARRLGVNRATVSLWENGKTEPSASKFVRWAAITGQPLEWLAEGVNDETPAEAGDMVRPKGFEPPTFWSVVSARQPEGSGFDLGSLSSPSNRVAMAGVILLAAMLRAVRS